jgi:hypothetical protein
LTVGTSRATIHRDLDAPLASVRAFPRPRDSLPFPFSIFTLPFSPFPSSFLLPFNFQLSLDLSRPCREDPERLGTLNSCALFCNEAQTSLLSFLSLAHSFALWGRGVPLASQRSNDPIAPLFHIQLLCFQPIAHSLAPINPTTPLQSTPCALRAPFCSGSAFSVSLRFCFPPGFQPSTVNFQPSLSPSPLQCPATIKPEGK